jgi:uridine nucleosidase
MQCDPEAAHSLFSNAKLAAKTTMIPLDTTHLVFGTQAVREKLLQSTTEAVRFPVRQLFHEIMIFFAKTYIEVFGMDEGPPMHDPLAVAAAFAPELFDDTDGERYRVDVVRDDAISGDRERPVSQCGRTVAKKLPPGEGGIKIPRRLDTGAFWDMINQCLNKAEV